MNANPPTQRPRVLFITRKWPPAVGGMEVYCRELVTQLRERADVDLWKLDGRSDGRVPSLPALLAFGMRCAVRLLAKPVHRDIVHGGDLAVWPLVALARVRNPKVQPVLSAHGTDIALAFRKGMAAGIYRAYMRLGVKLLGQATILANSRATAGLCREIGFSRVATILLGTGSGEPADMPSPERHVVFAGRLLASKGCGWFIREVLPLLDSGLNLVVAGVAWDRSESILLDDPRVEFRGPVRGKELADLRRAALAVIVPNLDMGRQGFEGFGLAATEAAADGGVVLAADVYGVSDAVLDGKTGFLLPAGDARAWANKIAEVANWTTEHRTRFIKRSCKSVMETYGWNRVADETLLAYAELMGALERV